MTARPDTFEFQDSEVGRITAEGDRLNIRLSAAQVHWRGVSGFLSGVEITCTSATWHGDLHHSHGALSEGHLLIDGVRLKQVPLSFAQDGGVVLTLDFKNHSSLTVHARQVTVQPEAAARFTESVAC